MYKFYRKVWYRAVEKTCFIVKLRLICIFNWFLRYFRYLIQRRIFFPLFFTVLKLMQKITRNTFFSTVRSSDDNSRLRDEITNYCVSIHHVVKNRSLNRKKPVCLPIFLVNKKGALDLPSRITTKRYWEKPSQKNNVCDCKAHLTETPVSHQKELQKMRIYYI